MKNDVVRWSGEPTSNTISSSSSSSSSFNCNSIHNRGCHKHKSKGNKLNARKLGQHAARSCQQRAAPEQQQTIIECDIRNFNLNCNLFKTSYITQCQPRLSGSSSPSSSRNRKKANSRHLARTKAWLLSILQISAVVFLCNFNVGFVAGSVASSASPPPAPPSPPASLGPKLDSNGQSPVLPPYVLDYETDGRAKLTPSNSNGNGKYGSSGSGNQNQIAGHYTHTWAVHIPDGDNGKADAVAKDHGFVNLGKVSDNNESEISTVVSIS